MPEEVFNFALLLLARQYMRMSQADVAQAAGLNQGHYSRIENGLLLEGPSRETAQRIADAVGFPVEFFYESDGLAGLPLSVHPMHRRKQSVGERELKQVHADLNIQLIHVRRYLRAVDLSPELPLPFYDVDDAGGPREVARAIRRAWLIADGPITNLTEYCERAGILVIPCEFAAPIDGVTMAVRGLPPCIFLNNSIPADRMRFSLAHELGHIIMHRVPTDGIEKEANAFAGELLVPERFFRKAVVGQRITLDWLARQKSIWKVSMNSLLVQVGGLGVLTEHQETYLWKRLSARGWRTREPEETDFASEAASVFPRIVRLHSEELGYDENALRGLLKCPARIVWKLYGPYLAPGGAGGLRLVK